MSHAHQPLSEVQNVLKTLHDRHRLSGLVRVMAQKIELLDEDNRQLRAAITIYGEILRRSNPNEVANCARAS
jgi:F0F1-type ATP synthase delta subunit